MNLIKSVMNITRGKCQQVLALVGLSTVSVSAMAAGDLASIGDTVATKIGEFLGVVGTIGGAVLGVIILIQGFRMAYSMVKSAR